jgi:microsomal dipeptidase-like Zn-dependent dipeptidase
MQTAIRHFAAIISSLFFALVFSYDAAAQKSSDSVYPPMTGYVDMHTHPRSDLSFGGQLFYGCPYGDISVELKNCRAYHDGWSMSNLRGNLFRQQLAEQAETQYSKTCKDKKIGYPDFATWPSWCSVLHQQMWVDWIERAHQGGLNIMVALATGSHCLTEVAKTEGIHDDEFAIAIGIEGIKALVAHSTFMEIALTPQDVRRIVASGKLAVILGIEIDNIGNFYKPADHYQGNFNLNPTDWEIQAELDKLWDMGIRYIFPIHLTNNIFGGAAIYISQLTVSNKFNTGMEFVPEHISTKESGIAFHLEHPVTGLNRIARMVMPLILPREINPARKKNYTFWKVAPGFGHRNSLGLTDKGRFAVRYMMDKGFLIDIDHMGEKTANAVLDIAGQADYPVNSGHNGLRGTTGNENERTIAQYARIKDLGGMIGLGHGNYASNFVRNYRQVIRAINYDHVAIGTDVNGFYPLPHCDTSIAVTYDSIFARCRTGSRTWDINIDGVAHYGLMPDYIRSWTQAGMTAQEMQAFMSSAEHFTQMWEKCEHRKGTIVNLTNSVDLLFGKQIRMR